MSKVSMICVAYRRPVQIKVTIASMLAQTFQDWELLVIHDGPEGAEEIRSVCDLFADSRIRFENTEVRYNDFGHSLRELGLSKVTGEFVGHTNDDNYYAPVYLERMVAGLESGFDFVYCNMLHSYGGWTPVDTVPRWGQIDGGGWLARKSILPVQWKDKSMNGDGHYVEQIIEAGVKVIKISGILFIHN